MHHQETLNHLFGLCQAEPHGLVGSVAKLQAPPGWLSGEHVGLMTRWL